MIANEEVRLRVNVRNPPEGVRFQMQRGRAALAPPTARSPKLMTFDFTVRVGTRPGGEPNLLGEFTQGPPAARFVYINSGTLAGQPDSCWSRRAKVPLTNISWTLIEEARASGGVIEADISLQIAAEVASLPDFFHRDPADRLIVATSRALGVPVLTHDILIAKSGLVRRWRVSV